MKLLLIHQAFVVPGEPGGTRHFEFLSRMVREGDEAAVVASPVGYLAGERGRKVRAFSREQHDGVEVRRAWVLRSLHRGFAWRVLSFFSFMGSSCLVALRVKDVDLVMGTSPPIFQAAGAAVVAKLLRRPFLLEVRDLWPEFAVDMGVLTNPALIAASRWLEAWLYRRADHILVNSPAYRDYMLAKGLRSEDVSLIPNGVDVAMFDPEADGRVLREQLGFDDGTYVVTYAGALGPANDIGTILRAARQLPDSVQILLVGDGAQRLELEQLAQELELENVNFVGAVPKEAMRDYLAASDACLATLQDIPLFKTTYPNKVFDYMAAGRPTVLGIDGVIRDVLEAAEGGVFTPPGRPDDLAAAITSLASKPEEGKAMGRRARDYVARHFDREEHARSFARLTRRMAQRGLAQRGIYRRGGKRVVDLCAAAAGLVCAAPLAAAVGAAVAVKLGRPVLFAQDRPGRDGRSFRMYKFRSMREGHDSQGHPLPDAERLTPFGRLLRSTSLDELPELWNVLKGDMSLVGPRPLLEEYLPLYSDEQARRHDVRPGITGLAQVEGRNDTTWERRLELDVEYVERHGLLLDAKILLKTLAKVLKRDGVAAAGHATMPRFQGSSAAGVST